MDDRAHMHVLDLISARACNNDSRALLPNFPLVRTEDGIADVSHKMKTTLRISPRLYVRKGERKRRKTITSPRLPKHGDYALSRLQGPEYPTDEFVF